MKRILAILILYFFPLCILNAQIFYIKGKTTNAYSKPLYISYYSDLLKKSITDSTTVNDYHFQFKGMINMPALALLRTTNSKDLENTAILFIEPGEMLVSINTDDMSDVKLTGSYSGRVYDTLTKLRSKLSDTYQSTMDSINRFGKNGVSFETKRRQDEYFERFYNLDTSFMLARPNSIVTAFFLPPYFRILSRERILTYYKGMGNGLRNSVYGEQVEVAINRKSIASIGDMSYNFDSRDVNQNLISLRQFQGRYVLLDFWASWCVPCREENPELIKLYKKYHPKGLEIISIADDDKHLQAWKDAINTDGTGIWHQILRGSDEQKALKGIFNPNDLNKLYGVGVLPTKILIDKTGKIIYNSKYQNDFDFELTLKNIFEK